MAEPKKVKVGKSELDRKFWAVIEGGNVLGSGLNYESALNLAGRNQNAAIVPKTVAASLKKRNKYLEI